MLITCLIRFFKENAREKSDVDVREEFHEILLLLEKPLD
jgi:hypothetical protein